MMKAKKSQKAPLLSLSEWVQGKPVNFDRLSGRVVLVEVFQGPTCCLFNLSSGYNDRQLNKNWQRLGMIYKESCGACAAIAY